MKATGSSVDRVLVLLATACLLWKEAACFSASGINKAFATFYGGSDASGTMGKNIDRDVNNIHSKTRYS
jgi:hypothetical protein